MDREGCRVAHGSACTNVDINATWYCRGRFSTESTAIDDDHDLLSAAGSDENINVDD